MKFTIFIELDYEGVYMDFIDKLKELPSINEIKGGIGEEITKYYSKLITNALVLRDVLIDGKEGETSQIDIILVYPKGIFVVEVKTYANNAMIYGDGERSNWYYYLGGKKIEIYSPLKQNAKHIEYLKVFLKDFGDIPYFNVVTMMCKDFKMDNINKDPRDPFNLVCSSLPAMSLGLMKLKHNRPDILPEEKRQEIYEFILTNQHMGKESRKIHKENVREIRREQEEMKKQHICPYCKKPMILRKGKNGNFYGCQNYPKCKYTLKM